MNAVLPRRRAGDFRRRRASARCGCVPSFHAGSRLMFFNWFRNGKKNFFHSNTRNGLRRNQSRRLEMDCLEDRCLPAVFTWTGAGSTNLWSDFQNWQGNVAPQAGADLVFPEIALQKTNVNNFGPATDFNSITFNGGGYTLGGN